MHPAQLRGPITTNRFQLFDEASAIRRSYWAVGMIKYDTSNGAPQIARWAALAISICGGGTPGLAATIRSAPRALSPWIAGRGCWLFKFARLPWSCLRRIAPKLTLETLVRSGS